MKFYHGTTLENARDLFSGREKNKPVWNCSYDDYLYLWSLDAVKDEMGLDADDEAERFAVQLAFESAQITAATSENPQKELFVFCFELSDSEVFEDLSCDNVDMARRIKDYDSKFLTRNLIGVFHAKHNSRLDAFYLMGILDNDLLIKDHLDQSLLEAAKTLLENKCYIESEFDWRSYGKKDFLLLWSQDFVDNSVFSGSV